MPVKTGSPARACIAKSGGGKQRVAKLSQAEQCLSLPIVCDLESVHVVALYRKSFVWKGDLCSPEVNHVSISMHLRNEKISTPDVRSRHEEWDSILIEDTYTLPGFA